MFIIRIILTEKKNHYLKSFIIFYSFICLCPKDMEGILWLFGSAIKGELKSLITEKNNFLKI